ncbi:phage virion morphogenesis protein [Antarcticimicrobium sediminis]|uniref:Phage virion morphogenesis protein n=1 Tax=Antarcticimicrobium sediminis TaxID=2546227 RepID=A0A4R5F0P4_9RHOB|nr:phage virion morphogenesis protein [Antarcticimicrobium sediminis]TDE40933.1 phage virion morphogenesis protein [Antarcticimicrobium sediminis]
MIKIGLNDDISGMLEQLATRLTDMTPVMQDLGELLTESTKQRFKDGVSPDGATWAPKSQTTIEAYEARKDKVDLRPLFGPSGRLSSEIHYVAGAHSVELGSSLIYSAVQQLGADKGAFGSMANDSPIPWGNIPARPFLGLSDDDQIAITETIQSWLLGGTDSAH